jgi:hypothetical protein
MKSSLFDDHVPPIDIYDQDLFVCDCCKLVGIMSPEGLYYLLSSLVSPFDLFPHRVKYHDLVAVQQD